MMTSGPSFSYPDRQQIVTILDPRINNGQPIGAVGGISLTSDLGSSYDSFILKLSGYDYGSIGGNPFTKAHYGFTLKGIHFEPFKTDAAPGKAYIRAFNAVANGDQDGGYFVSGVDAAGKPIHGKRHGTDTYYVNVGVKLDSTLTVTIVHEALHESILIDRLAATLAKNLSAYANRAGLVTCPPEVPSL